MQESPVAGIHMRIHFEIQVALLLLFMYVYVV